MAGTSTEQSIQAYLNSLSQLPGSVLYRDSISWQALAPGNAGQILALNQNAMPEWSQGLRYNPARIDFHDSASWYGTSNYTSVGNKCSMFLLIRRTGFTGGANKIVLWSQDAANDTRMRFVVTPTDHANPNFRDNAYLWCEAPGGADMLRLFTPAGLLSDGNYHFVGCSYDADNGQSRLFVDGLDADDTSNTSRLGPQIGTLASGVNSDFGVGASESGFEPYGGQLGMCGMIDDFIDDWTTFPTNPEYIWQINETTWEPFPSIPVYWNPYGIMTDNKGTGPNLASFGTPTLIAE